MTIETLPGSVVILLVAAVELSDAAAEVDQIMGASINAGSRDVVLSSISIIPDETNDTERLQLMKESTVAMVVEPMII